MPERKTVIGIAVATALGIGTFAAIRYNKSFEKSAEDLRCQIVGLVAGHINYAELIRDPEGLASFCQQIPGEWRISSVIADILAEPDKHWEEVYGPTQSIAGPGSSFFQEFRPADKSQLSGLYLFREHTENPMRESRFFRDIVLVGRVTNWLVGKSYLPRYLRRAF